MQETQDQSLGQEDTLEKEVAIHSIILAWEIPWKMEPGGYSPWIYLLPLWNLLISYSGSYPRLTSYERPVLSVH